MYEAVFHYYVFLNRVQVQVSNTEICTCIAFFWAEVENGKKWEENTLDFKIKISVFFIKVLSYSHGFAIMFIMTLAIIVPLCLDLSGTKNRLS